MESFRSKVKVKVAVSPSCAPVGLFPPPVAAPSQRSLSRHWGIQLRFFIVINGQWIMSRYELHTTNKADL